MKNKKIKEFLKSKRFNDLLNEITAISGANLGAKIIDDGPTTFIAKKDFKNATKDYESAGFKVVDHIWSHLKDYTNDEKKYMTKEKDGAHIITFFGTNDNVDNSLDISQDDLEQYINKLKKYVYSIGYSFLEGDNE